MREHLGQPAQHAVVGAEVMAPLADAVRLVDGHQGDGPSRQPAQHGRLHQPLGREVQDVEPALADGAPDALALVGIDIGVEPRCSDARLLQAGDLVGHQGDQGRDDDPQPVAQHAGHLVAQALAAAGGQDGEGVAARHHLGDHVSLEAAEVVVAEGAAQHLARLVHGRIGGHRRYMPQSKKATR